MYRSLLFQILTAIPDLQEKFILLAHTKTKDNEICEWDIEELKNILSTAIENLGEQHLVCFIDALDECEEDQVRDMVSFLEQLGFIAVSAGIRLNIYLSSRHYPHIGIEKGISLIMEGQPGHDQDIEKYVNSKLKAGRSKQIDQVKAEILSRASGVFLWVVIVVQMLNKAYDHGQIYALKKRLKEIPNELDELFADILTRDSENKEELLLCLQWILYAQRPLKRPELYFAIMSGIEHTELTEWDPEGVTTQDMEKFILSCSKGLAEVTKAKDQTVQFIHESVRDFLLQKNGPIKLQSDLGSDFVGLSHERLKQCCNRYITLDVSQQLPLNLPLPAASPEEGKTLRILATEKFPFLEYAVQNMLYHADAAQFHGISQNEFLEGFLSAESRFGAWIILDNLLERYEIRRHTHEASLLYILAEKDLHNLIPIQLQRDPNIDIIGERYGTPVHAALFNANEGAIRAMLKNDSATYSNTSERQKNLVIAKMKRYDESIKFLLQERADIKSNARNGETLLSYAAQSGHEDVVELLLSTNKINVDARNKRGRTPLSLAASSGHEPTVKLLLATGKVDIDSRDNNGWTPLSLAAYHGYESVVRLLLATGKVDIDSRDNDGRTPLSYATSQGRQNILKLYKTT